MSFSKLESLPNEILIDIIEKYINGVDVLVALSCLNGRFNSLISQCQRLHFNFIQCHKTDFCFCMGLLPAYIDKIEELAISEEDTPGQVFAFLNFFPSFALFKRLHTLHLNINGETADSYVNRTLLSISDTSITTLSIRAINALKMSPLDIVILKIFNLKSLKRFSFIADSYYTNWDELLKAESHIEHLTISGLNCGFQHILYICQIAPHLKYLDMAISNTTPPMFYEAIKYRKRNIKSTCQLRTLLLSFQQNDRTNFDMLAAYFRYTPLLKRLEIEGHNTFLSAYEWESVLESSLPLLNYFSLQIAVSVSHHQVLHIVLRSFQTPFWIDKKNFSIMFTEHQKLSSEPIQFYRMSRYKPSEFHLPVINYQIAPDRTANGDLMIVNELLSFKLSDVYSTVSRHYYLDNVKCLVVDNMNITLLEWVTTYVNCFRITELIITGSRKKIPILTSLLACIPNITSLHTTYDQLIINKDAFMGKHNTLKRLDISPNLHAFHEKAIIFIAKLFPHLEHLEINTPELDNVPVLKTYLPQLRSLSFKLLHEAFRDYNFYGEKMSQFKVLQETTFLFEHKEDTITVWIDWASFKDTFSRKLSVESSVTTTASGGNKKTNDIFSFFKFFK